MQDTIDGHEFKRILLATPLQQCSEALRAMLSMRAIQYEYLRTCAVRLGTPELVIAVNQMSSTDFYIGMLIERFLNGD